MRCSCHSEHPTAHWGWTRQPTTQAEVRANEMVVGGIQGEMSAQVLLILCEGQSLAAEHGILLAQGQVQSLDEAGGDLERIDVRRVAMDHALGHRDEPAATFPMLDELDVAELRQRDLRWVARAPGTTRTGIGHLEVPTVE